MLTMRSLLSADMQESTNPYYLYVNVVMKCAFQLLRDKCTARFGQKFRAAKITLLLFSGLGYCKLMKEVQLSVATNVA